MKLALQLSLIPGKNTLDKVKWAKDQGVEAIELSSFVGGAMPDRLYEMADEMQGVLPVCSVCGNATRDGGRGFDFLDPDPEKRRASIEGSKAILKFCGDVGAVGQIVPPIFGPPVVPDLSPVMNPLQIEEKLMVAALKKLGPIAARHKTLFMVEPLNRYEQHYLRTQQDGVRVIEKAKVKGLGLLSDLFHMHIEETSSPDALRKCGKHTAHVHLADNTRMEPGTGDIDFVAAFRALRKAGFKGYMAFECGITGEGTAGKRRAIRKSLDTLRSCIKKAKRK